MPEPEMDYYEVLGVPKTASGDEIKAAYHRLAFKYHPDRNSHAYAGEWMKKINQAYNTLSSPEKRAEYDRGRSYGSGFSGFSGRGENTGSHGTGGYSWKKEYTWTWSGQSEASGTASRRGRASYSASSGQSSRWSSKPGRPGGASGGQGGGGNSNWETLDLILRIFGALALFWLILRKPMLIVFFLIAAAFLLAVWLLAMDLMRIMGGKK